jgi:hypothetical protein
MAARIEERCRVSGMNRFLRSAFYQLRPLLQAYNFYLARVLYDIKAGLTYSPYRLDGLSVENSKITEAFSWELKDWLFVVR